MGYKPLNKTHANEIVLAAPGLINREANCDWTQKILVENLIEQLKSQEKMNKTAPGEIFIIFDGCYLITGKIILQILNICV